MVDKTSDVSDKEQHGGKFLPQKKNIILPERNVDYSDCSVTFNYKNCEIKICFVFLTLFILRPGPCEAGW